MKILLASFYTPGVRAIENLIQAGIKPHHIRVLTHEEERNNVLLSYSGMHGIEVKTFSVKSEEALDWVKAYCPDIIFSLYFRDIIPKVILDIPRLGAVNLHPALLPNYRGTFSVPWAIINGEEWTGFTYHYMVPQVDAGKIILQQKIQIRPDDTAYSLYHRLIIEGFLKFDDAFELVVERRYEGKSQIGEGSYFSRKLPFEGYINPSWDRSQIDRFIRAMFFPPFKGAFVRLINGEEKEISSLAEYDNLTACGNVIKLGNLNE